MYDIEKIKIYFFYLHIGFTALSIFVLTKILLYSENKISQHCCNDSILLK